MTAGVWASGSQKRSDVAAGLSDLDREAEIKRPARAAGVVGGLRRAGSRLHLGQVTGAVGQQLLAARRSVPTPAIADIA